VVCLDISRIESQRAMEREETDVPPLVSPRRVATAPAAEFAVGVAEAAQEAAAEREVAAASRARLPLKRMRVHANGASQAFQPAHRRRSRADAASAAENAALEALRSRLLLEELPYSLNRALQLLRQVLDEVEPRSSAPEACGGFLRADPPPVGLIHAAQSTPPQRRSSRSTPGLPPSSSSSIGSTGNASVSSLKIPALNFLRRGTSSVSKREQVPPQDAASVKRPLEGVALYMSHTHKDEALLTTTRSGSSATSAGSSSHASSSQLSAVGAAPRNFTRKGFTVKYGNAASSAAPSVSYSTSPGTWMDVALHLDGFFIRHADINLRLHRHAKNPVTRVSSSGHHNFHTQLHQPPHPWMLDQVYKVHMKAKEQIAKLEQFLNRFRTLPPEKQSSEAQRCMHDLVVALIECRNAMTNPSPSTFPESLKTADTRKGSQIFNPCPPAEILIEFSAHLGELVVSAFELQYLSTNKDHPVQTDASWSQKHDITNKLFGFSDPKKVVQVVDQVQVHFKVHSFQWMMDNVYDAYNVAIRMLRKIEAFNRHDLSTKLRSKESQPSVIDQFAKGMKEIACLPPLDCSNWAAGQAAAT